MTLALIIASKGKVHIVSDSQSIDEHTFSCNTKKAFFSHKHNIGLCISGEAVLKFPGIETEDQVLYVDFVISEFMDFIDDQEECGITDFKNTLDMFIIEHYPEYWTWFNERVCYYYGGFVNDGEVKSVIGQHHVRRSDDNTQLLGIDEDIWFFSEEGDQADCYYANTNAVASRIDWTLTLPGLPDGMTAKKLLLDDTEREKFLTFTVPYACLAVNQEEPRYIGSHLHHLTLTPGSICERVIKYREAADAPLGIIYVLNPIDVPPYIVHRSYAESNAAFMNGELRKFLRTTGEQVQPPNAAQEQPDEEAVNAVLHP